MTKRISKIGETLHRLMNREGISQAELSRLSGVGQSSISRIILGEDRNPRISTLKSLAKALHTSVCELVGEERTMPLPDPVTYFHEYYDVDEATARNLRNMVDIVLQIGKRPRQITNMADAGQTYDSTQM